MMIELYILPQFPIPFPQKLIGEYDLEQLVTDFRFTDEEIDKALDGEIVRERFVVRAEPAFYKMQKELVEEATRDAHPEGLTMAEVAKIMGIEEGTVKALLHTAKKKLSQSPEFKKTLEQVVQYKNIQTYSIGKRHIIHS